MMNRIQKKFESLKKKKKKALIVFITAGDPSLKKTEDLVYAFEKNGVDLIELGVPFSDPIADGPVIQASSLRALQRGTSLTKILKLTARIRKKSQTPLLLMSYFNPIFHYGIPRFAKDASRAGVDGVIIPDLPPEEGMEISPALRRYQIDLVYLLAPTSDHERQKKVIRASRGFVYYVSLTGVTGARKSIASDARRNLKAIRRQARLPVCVGFGVSTPAQAKTMSGMADGVIIGSAVVRALMAHPGIGAENFSKRFIRPFAKALGKKV